MSKTPTNTASNQTIASPSLVSVSTPDEMVELVNDAHAIVLAAHQCAVERAMEMGRLLIAVKEDARHGSFTYWIETNTKFSIRTAQRYMKLATEVPKLGKAEATRVSLLSLREGLAAVQKTADDALKVRQPDRIKVLNRALKNDQSINRESDEGQRRHAVKVRREHQPKPVSGGLLPPEGTPDNDYKVVVTGGEPAPEQDVVEQVDGEWEVVDEDSPDKPAPPVERPKRLPPFKRATSTIVYTSINTSDLDSTVDGFMHEVDHDVLKDLAEKILERLAIGGAA